MSDHDPTQTGDSSRLWNLSETLKGALATGWLAVNHSGSIAAINTVAERFLAKKAALYLGHPCETLPPPLGPLIRETLETGKSIVNREMLLKLSGQTECHLLIDAARFSFSPKELSGVAITLRNLDAMQNLEANLRHLDRLASIGTYYAAVSHEVKNALVPVKTFLQLLSQKYPEAELSSLAQQELGRVECMITQMLKFGVPASTEFVEVPLQEMLQRCVSLIGPHLKARGVELDLRVQPEPQRVRADAHQLQQAFLNVFLNALDAMEAGGELRVETFRQFDAASGSPQLVVQVGDTGAGIQPEHMRRIFDTFFTTKPQGTGLGLAITRRILQEHHGEIELESQPGQGTIVRMYFPILED